MPSLNPARAGALASHSRSAALWKVMNSVSIFQRWLSKLFLQMARIGREGSFSGVDVPLPLADGKVLSQNWSRMWRWRDSPPSKRDLDRVGGLFDAKGQIGMRRHGEFE